VTRARVAGAVLLLAPAASRLAATSARLAAAGRRAAAARLVARARLVALVVALFVAAPLLVPAPARADDVSAAELRTLARDAVDDPAALARLREVDSVDGRRVDVGGALRGARGAALAARLEALAAPYGVTSGGSDPRAEARDVLAESRFHETDVPGPFRGVFEWIGDRLPDIDVPLDWLDDLLPGGRSVVWIVLGGLLAGLAWFVARRFLTSRIRASTEAEQALVAARDEDPRALDRRADAAEAAGDLEAALRLRFRAGLLRLDARGAIEFRPSISTYEVRRALRSDDFDALAATFDDVVYGGRPPATDDLAAARERWPAIIKGSDPSTKAAT
jgi:hypothetical protein